MYAVLAAWHKIIASRIMDRWIVYEELVQAEPRIPFDDGPADVAGLDFMELVALRVVIRWAGRLSFGAGTVGASRVHVVTLWAVDGRVQVEELRGGEVIGRRNRLAIPGGNEVTLGAVGDQ